MNELPEYMKPVMSLVVYKTEKSVNTYIEEHAIRELQENKFATLVTNKGDIKFESPPKDIRLARLFPYVF